MKKISFKRKYFAFPYAFLCVVFVVVPLVLMLYFAFTDFEGAFTFDNFACFFTEKETQNVLWRSLGMALLATIICFLLAYPLAYFLSRAPFNKVAVLVVLFVTPMWINSLLRIYAVKLLFGDIFGMERGFLLTLIGMVYDFFPFMLLPIYNILEDMDKGVLEASADLGANPVRSFLTVKLPLSVPGIVSGVLMVFMPTVSSFAIYDILGYDGGSAGFLDGKLFGNIVYTYFEKGYYNSGSALALILLVLIFISTMVSNIVTKGKAGKTGGTIS